jgi:hypothetical protein
MQIRLRTEKKLKSEIIELTGELLKIKSESIRLACELTVLDLGRPSISGSIRSIKMIPGLIVQCKRDWCVEICTLRTQEEQGLAPLHSEQTPSPFT